MTGKLEARRFFISGMVQGVGFRFFAERAAERLGLAGYVMNRRDGRVEVYAIGQPALLRALGDELARGPRMASVSDVQEEAAEYDARYADGFTIERDW